MSTKPDDISQEAWDRANRLPIISENFDEGDMKIVALAIDAAKAEEREACAAIIDEYMLCSNRMGDEVLISRANSGNHIGVAYAAAIRKREEA